MRYGSVCSGIESATVAWKPLGWQSAFFAEIEPFCCAVLHHHYPEVPNLGDFTKIETGSIDVLVGGTPCQSFSVAGRRAGLDDPRGVLALEFLRLCQRLRPRWFVFENVPGLLSSDKGRDFGAFLGAVGECGYSCAWRVLDAQYFGVAQRRERVFVVGHLGTDWRPSAAVLFDAPGLRWNPPPSRETGERVAPTVEARANAGGTGCGTDFLAGGGLAESRGQDPVLVCPTLRAGKNETGGDRPPGTDVDTADSLIAMCLNSEGGSGRIDGESETFVAHSLRSEGFDASEGGTGRGAPIVAMRESGQGYWMEDKVAGTLDMYMGASRHANRAAVVAFHENQRTEVTLNETVGSLKVGGGKPGQGYPAVAFTERTRDASTQRQTLNQGGQGSSMQVRRLTPL